MSALLEPAAQPVDVIPLSAHIGAEIRGVDLTQPLTTPQISAIRAALLKWRVIFPRAIPHARAACRVLRAVRRADGRPPGVRARRRASGRLLDREASQGDALRRRTGAPPVDRLAHRRDGRREPAVGVDPAWRDDPAVRRRHALDEPRAGVRNAVARCASSTACAAFTASRRRPARAPPVRSTTRSSAAARHRASARARASGDRRTRVVRGRAS